MWQHFCQKYNGSVVPDLMESIYVGDAAGRPEGWDGPTRKRDFSCSDRKFAFNIGIPFETPEECFLQQGAVDFEWRTLDPRTLPLDVELFAKGLPLISESQELVLCVGPPASGKSTFTKNHMVKHGYYHVNQDTLKTKQKCLDITKQQLTAGKSVVVDNTNPSSSVRREYIAIADYLDIPTRCFYFGSNMELAHHLNLLREKVTGQEHVPNVAYASFESNFQEPSRREGFIEVKQINFRPTFGSKVEEELFYQFT